MNHEILSPAGAALLFFAAALVSPQSADAGPRSTRARDVVERAASEREELRAEFGEAANLTRGEAIDLLEEILDEQTLPPGTQAEMLLRLAELQFEQSRHDSLAEMADFDRRWEDWINRHSEHPTEPEPVLDTTSSSAWAKLAIDSYRTIIKDHPSYRRLDEAVFFLGYTLDEIGQPTEALEQYKTVVRHHPDSAFVPDAWFEIGEYYFERDNSFKALRAYKSAAAFPESHTYTLALYRSAWCYYNIGEFKTGIEVLEEVVRETDRLVLADRTSPISMRAEALRDMVVFLVQETDIELAEQILDRHALPEYYRTLVTKLGDLYLERGENELAIGAWRRLMSRDPDAPDNPSLQARVVDSFRQRDRFDEADDELERMVERYGTESRWAAANVDNQETLLEAERLLEKGLRGLTIEAHQQALQRRSAKLLLLAEGGYERYLAAFPTDQHSYEMRYWYAEVLYKLERFEQAADHYEQVVAADRNGRFLQDAAANSIFAIERVLQPIERRLDREAEAAITALKASEDGYAELELHPWEARLVTACDTYAQALPKGDRTLKFLYKAALLLHDRNRFNESNDRFLAIVRADPKSYMAEHGIHTILRSYEQIENWSGLAAAAAEFRGNDDVGKTLRFRAELKDIEQRATFKVAEEYAETGDHPRAAVAFENFWDRFDDSDVRDLALYNAAHYFELAGEPRKALDLRLRFVESYPEPLGDDARAAQLYEKSLALLGRHYASVAAWDEAATAYRALFDANPRFEAEGFLSARDAVYDAGLFREALGDIDGATRDLGDYTLTEGVEPADRIAASMRIARLLGRAGRTEEAASRLRAIVADPVSAEVSFASAMEAHVLLGRLMEDPSQREAHYRSVLRQFASETAALPATAPALDSVAEMEFRVLEGRFEDFDSMPVTGTTTAARRGLARRSEKLLELEEQYVDVLERKQGEWGIAALYRIGTLYADLARDVIDTPCPRQLTEDQCEVYRYQLIDQMEPLVGTAVKRFGQARDRSHDLGIYTPYTQAALDELSRARPEEYPPLAELLPPAGYMAGAFSGETTFVR